MASPVKDDIRPQPTRTTVDDVPLFWAEGPEPCTGALLFRAGRADETLPIAGVTHLVEHLALYPFGRQPYEYNGAVEENVTLFYATGRREEVVEFLSQCAGHLAELPYARLEDEKRVLGVEAEASHAGLYGQLLSFRYGACAYGLMAFKELGLRRLEEPDVTDWAGRFFTRGNAVAWMSASPDGLTLPLPEGSRHPAPEPRTIDELSLPAQVWHPDRVVAVTFEGERSSALNTGFAIAADRVHERLRREEGLTYSPGGAYHPLTADRVHLMLVTDCAETNAAPVRDGLLSILDDLAEHGPTEAELDWHRSMVARQFSDPRSVLAQLDSYARRELIGGDPIDDETLTRELEALTPQEVAAAVSEVMGSMLLSVPHGTPKSTREGLLDYEADSRATVRGDGFPARRKWQQYGIRDELYVGREGVTYVPRPAGDALTIRFEDCVAAIEGQDNSLNLASRTGTSLRVSPALYEDGERALEMVRSSLSDEIAVPLDDAGRKVDEAARRYLSDDRHAPLANELEWLATTLAPDEPLRSLAEAKRERFQGLLAITDRRMFFLFSGAENDFRELPLHEVKNVRTRGFVNPRLTMVGQGEDLVFRDVWPNQRLKEIEELLRSGVR
jgi:zinc protease